VPTANNELTNKLYVDDVINDILDSNNVWTGTNDFTNAGGINVGANSSNYVNLKGSGTITQFRIFVATNKANCISIGRFSGDENTGGNNICLAITLVVKALNIGSINIGSYAGLHETNNTEENRFSINIGHNSAREPKSILLCLTQLVVFLTHKFKALFMLIQ
jgi:hypothetical protein